MSELTEKVKMQREMYDGKNVGAPPPRSEPLPWHFLKKPEVRTWCNKCGWQKCDCFKLTP